MLFQVTIENTSEMFRCAEEMNVLEAMEKARCKGIPVGCRNGGCGACKVRVTNGRYIKRKMNRAVLSAEEEAQGCVLACKTYPQSDLALSVLGRRWGGATEHGSGSFSFEFPPPPPLSQRDKET